MMIIAACLTFALGAMIVRWTVGPASKTSKKQVEPVEPMISSYALSTDAFTAI